MKVAVMVTQIKTPNGQNLFAFYNFPNDDDEGGVEREKHFGETDQVTDEAVSDWVDGTNVVKYFILQQT